MNKESLLSRIAEAEAQLEEMRKELNKKEVWEPEGGSWYISGDGFLSNTVSRSSSKGFGTERKTKAAAEKARDEMRVFNRLLAYRDEFAPDYVVPPLGELAWYIEEEGDGDDREYFVDNQTYTRGISTVHMPRSVAEELCRKLNSGEVVL